MDPHLQLMVLLSPFIKSIHSNLVLPAGSYSKSYASAWIQASIQSQVEDRQAVADLTGANSFCLASVLQFS